MKFFKLFTALVLLFSLAGCSASISRDLQNHKWEFTAQKTQQGPMTAQFDDKNVTFIENNESRTYPYQLKKKAYGKTEFILSGHKNVSHRAPTKHFTIKKVGQSYQLSPTNKLAKHSYGPAKLKLLADD